METGKERWGRGESPSLPPAGELSTETLLERGGWGVDVVGALDMEPLFRHYYYCIWCSSYG